MMNLSRASSYLLREHCFMAAIKYLGLGFLLCGCCLSMPMLFHYLGSGNQGRAQGPDDLGFIRDKEHHPDLVF